MALCPSLFFVFLEHFPFYYNRNVISTEGRDPAVLFMQKDGFLTRSARFEMTTWLRYLGKCSKTSNSVESRLFSA